MNSSLTPVDIAFAHLLTTLRPVIEDEEIPVEEALGRVLACDSIAQINVPPHASSAMDGYAVIAQDTMQAPKQLAVTQRIAAGQVGTDLFPGQAARIFTGAPMPSGADAVVMQENCSYANGVVTILQSATPGENQRQAGEDIETGATLFCQGHRLRAQDLGVLASTGKTEIRVRRKLKVALLTTGDEIIQPGEKLLPGQIYNSNYFTLRALLETLQVEVLDMGVLRDDLESTQSMLEVASKSVDCIVTTGGVSVGEEDHVRTAVAALGKIELWKLAIKPGKPFASGKIGNAQFFGLPGNPVSAFVTFVLLVKPSLLTMLGCKNIGFQSFFIKAGFSAPESGARQEYLRVSLDELNGETTLAPYANQSSGVSASLSHADGLAVVPPHTAIKTGDSLRFISFSELLS
jgi:molybdopterin molybdotransferase